MHTFTYMQFKAWYMSSSHMHMFTLIQVTISVIYWHICTWSCALYACTYVCTYIYVSESAIKMFLHIYIHTYSHMCSSEHGNISMQMTYYTCAFLSMVTYENMCMCPHTCKFLTWSHIKANVHVPKCAIMIMTIC